MKDKGGSLRPHFPELYSTEPRKSNTLKFLKTKPYKRGFFHWYSNPEIGWHHVTDPSKKKGISKSVKKLGKFIGPKGSYPF